MHPVHYSQALTASGGTVMTTAGQVIATSTGNFPQQMLASLVPTNANQAVIIGQYGAAATQQSLSNFRLVAGSHKEKTCQQRNIVILRCWELVYVPIQRDKAEISKSASSFATRLIICIYCACSFLFSNISWVPYWRNIVTTSNYNYTSIWNYVKSSSVTRCLYVKAATELTWRPLDFAKFVSTIFYSSDHFRMDLFRTAMLFSCFHALRLFTF